MRKMEITSARRGLLMNIAENIFFLPDLQLFVAEDRFYGDAFADFIHTADNNCFAVFNHNCVHLVPVLRQNTRNCVNNLLRAKVPLGTTLQSLRCKQVGAYQSLFQNAL